MLVFSQRVSPLNLELLEGQDPTRILSVAWLTRISVFECTDEWKCVCVCVCVRFCSHSALLGSPGADMAEPSPSLQRGQGRVGGCGSEEGVRRGGGSQPVPWART